MPPRLALLLCTGFVVGLLWVDQRRTWGVVPKVSWVPTLWMLYCASRPVTSWFGTLQSDASVEAGNPLERAILSLLIALSLLLLAKRRINWSQTFRDNRWLAILFLYMLVSILWSDFPLVSFKRWVKTAGTAMMALVLLTDPAPLGVLEVIFRRTVYILIPFSVMLVKYFPHLGVGFGRWTGGTIWAGASMNKNMLGALCMFSVFFLTWTLVRRRGGNESEPVWYQTPADLLVLGLSLWLLRGPGGSYSATSVLVLILGFVAFFFLRRLKNGARSLGTVAWVTLLGAGLLLLVTNVVLETSLAALIAPCFGRDATLTGRADMIWSELIPFSLQQPILGVGYGAFWIRPFFEFAMRINQAHNGYLDVFIELGAVGLTLLTIFVVSYFNKARAEFEYDPDWASMRIAFLLIVLIHNCTETSFLRSTILLWNVFVFMMVVHRKRKSEKLTHGQ